MRRLLASADTLCRVFGRPSEANSLGSLGRLVFRTVLQVNDVADVLGGVGERLADPDPQRLLNRL